MPLASCTYRLNGERFSTLICDGRSFVAFSGNAERVNSPEAITNVDSGPLPTGRYYIVDRESGGRLGWLWNLGTRFASGTGRDQWFALYRIDGRIDDETYIDGVRRGNFRLHPIGRGRISKGCITLVSSPAFARLSAYLRSRELAYIPGTHIRCYGVVEVL
ncbi:MAG: DUF2778 domain-containing protein [Trinickia sp.]|uniref:DUF2778 domain-containing protein n=1 Tax=Trinickia sp. TaxID=2571163 RepID=UPI003F7E5303